jgi:uncharacterized protein (DUF1501 family)
MLPHSPERPAEAGVTRREFLRTGPLAVAGAATLAGPAVARPAPGGDRRLIVLNLVGGPSQLDTFDPKPAAPAEVRGPFRPIRTAVPGVLVSELFPRLAARADRFALVRTVHHAAPPIHETGQQLLQTGRLCRDAEHPHFGSVLSHRLGRSAGSLPEFAILPGPLGSTGVSVSHGQSAGYLGPAHEPAYPPFDLPPAPDADRDRYGPGRFARDCLTARRLVERGVRCVTVNMCDTVFDTLSWDCHADGGSLATTLDDYRTTLGPMLDRALGTLLDDLAERGLLESTLVLATGEFGRTPRINPRGGRDHWPGAWTLLMAGAGVCGGAVVGATDRWGGEPADRPVTPAEVAATVYHTLGFDPAASLPGPGGSLPLADAGPIGELTGEPAA